jgi:hypothetical protein
MPLHYASYKGHTDIVRILLKCGAEINAVDVEGKTPLLLACSESHEDTALLLMYKGANVLVRDRFGHQAMHVVSFRGNALLAKKILILSHYSVMGNADRYGDTPLHLACKHNHGEVIELLIESGADLCVENKFNKRPLDFIQSIERKKELMRMDSMYRLKSTTPPPKSRGSTGHTAIADHAVKWGKGSVGTDFAATMCSTSSMTLDDGSGTADKGIDSAQGRGRKATKNRGVQGALRSSDDNFGIEDICVVKGYDDDDDDFSNLSDLMPEYYINEEAKRGKELDSVLFKRLGKSSPDTPAVQSARQSSKNGKQPAGSIAKSITLMTTGLAKRVDSMRLTQHDKSPLQIDTRSDSVADPGVSLASISSLPAQSPASGTLSATSPHPSLTPSGRGGIFSFGRSTSGKSVRSANVSSRSMGGHSSGAPTPNGRRLGPRLQGQGLKMSPSPNKGARPVTPSSSSSSPQKRFKGNVYSSKEGKRLSDCVLSPNIHGAGNSTCTDRTSLESGVSFRSVRSVRSDTSGNASIGAGAGASRRSSGRTSPAGGLGLGLGLRGLFGFGCISRTSALPQSPSPHSPLPPDTAHLQQPQPQPQASDTTDYHSDYDDHQRQQQPSQDSKRSALMPLSVSSPATTASISASKSLSASLSPDVHDAHPRGLTDQEATALKNATRRCGDIDDDDDEALARKRSTQQLNTYSSAYSMAEMKL